MDSIADLIRRLKKLLNSRGRTAADSDDLIQEAFLRLQLYCRSRPVRQPEAFLVRTVLNLSVDEARSSRVRTASPEALETLGLIDSHPGPDEVLDGQNRLRRVIAGLAEVSPRAREVFLLHRIDGLSYAQIAARLGISVSAVEKNVAKAALFLVNWMDGA